jgi:hypothetical protein
MMIGGENGVQVTATIAHIGIRTLIIPIAITRITIIRSPTHRHDKDYDGEHLHRGVPRSLTSSGGGGLSIVFRPIRSILVGRRGRRVSLCRGRRRCRGRRLHRIAALQGLGRAVDHPIRGREAGCHLDAVTEIPAELD